MATAGLIGNIVKTNGSISGAEVGMSGRTGNGLRNGSGAAAQILGGSPMQIEYAAEMGFEHNLGLTRSRGRLCANSPASSEMPLSRRKRGSVQSILCSRMAGHKVSFDDVVETMMQTGCDMQAKYRETSLGGLARIYRAPLKKS